MKSILLATIIATYLCPFYSPVEGQTEVGAKVISCYECDSDMAGPCAAGSGICQGTLCTKTVYRDDQNIGKGLLLL